MMKLFFMMISMNFLTLMINKKMFNIYLMNYIIMMMLMMYKYNNFINYYWMNINYTLGLDFVSLSLILLTFWIIYLSMYSNNKFMLNNYNLMFMNIIIIMMNILYLCFSSMNIMIFYIFFETSLIPIMLIIMGWGMQIDRIQASMYMLFYTLVGSLPLLIMIMFMFNKLNTLMFKTLMMLNMLNSNLMLYTMLILAFMIKMPMYMTHLWLPKAHVEAPISGSMILAGIMLKLGSYGLYRSMIIFQNMMMNYNYMIIMFSIMGSLMASLICMNQNDMKIIVAYSSVVHMSILMASMMTMTNISMTGSLMMMIAHGLCSSGMFFLVNLNYERFKSRTLSINKGSLIIMPSLTLWWFLMFTSNFSAPPSLNLFSEILLFNSLVQWEYKTMLMIILISFFSTYYSIMMYAMSQYGKMNLFMTFKMINCREYLITALTWTPLNMLFLNMNLFMY